MANCSIPNSNLANGRTSTRSSRRLRRRNNQRTASVLVISRWHSAVQKRRLAGALQSALRARRIQSAIGSRANGIGETEGKAATGSGERARAAREFQSAIRRVKGAWWPSRSSKPWSSRKWRGRFDSYPLRLFIFDFRLPIADCHVATALRAVQQRRR